MKKERNPLRNDSDVTCSLVLLCLLLFLLVSCTSAKQKPTLTFAPPTKYDQKPALNFPPPIKVEQKVPSVESIVHDQGDAVVLIVTYDESGTPLSLGSGFFVKSDGVFITNYHVIEGSYSGVIKLIDGRVLGNIEIIDFNSEWDIAILKVEGSGFPTVKLGNSDIVKSGQKIVVIGNPEGLQNTVSDGLVSSIRKIESEGDYFIQISAPISEGSSGGPVYNMNGEVIGIATMMLKSGQNLNFAIPIKFALPLVEKSAQKDLATFTKEVTQKELDEYLKYQKNSTELKPEDTIFEYALNYYKQAEEKAGGYLSVFGTNNQEAIELLKKVINKDPNYHAAHYVLGLSYQLQIQFELAQKELLIANSLKPLYSDGHISLGEVYHKLGKFDEAINEYETAIKLSPDRSWVYYLLGKTYRDKKEYKKSIEHFVKAIELAKYDFLIAHFELAMTYSEIRDFTQALGAFREIDNTNMGTQYEGLDTGLELYKNIYDANKKNPIFLQDYAYIFFLKGDYENSIKYFSEAIKIDKAKFICNYELGFSYKDVPVDYTLDNEVYNRIYAQNLKKAEEYLNKAIKDTSPNYNAVVSLGEIYGNTYSTDRNTEKAISMYKMALQLKPSDIDSYHALSKLYLDIKNYSDAKEFAMKIISMDSKYKNAYNTLGDIYNEENNYDKAIENYNKYLDLSKGSSWVLDKIGRIYEDQELYAVALMKYKEAYEQSKSSKYLSSLHLSNIGRIYRKQKKYSDAIDTYKKIIMDYPNNSSAHFNLALTYRDNNQTENAIAEYQEALKLDPTESNAHYNLGLAYLIVNPVDKEKVIYHFKKYLDLTKDVKDDDEYRSRAKSFIAEIEFPSKLVKLKKQAGDAGAIASLLLFHSDYNEGNNQLINGLNATKHEDGENIVNSKIFVAESTFESLLVDIRKVKSNDTDIQDIINKFEKAVLQRIDGIKLLSKAFYTKVKDYQGEFEKGKAKVQTADKYYVDVLKALQDVMREYKNNFSEYEVDMLTSDIKYYSEKYKE